MKTERYALALQKQTAIREGNGWLQQYAGSTPYILRISCVFYVENSVASKIVPYAYDGTILRPRVPYFECILRHQMNEGLGLKVSLPQHQMTPCISLKNARRRYYTIAEENKIQRKVKFKDFMQFTGSRKVVNLFKHQNSLKLSAIRNTGECKNCKQNAQYYKISEFYHEFLRCEHLLIRLRIHSLPLLSSSVVQKWKLESKASKRCIKNDFPVTPCSLFDFYPSFGSGRE